MISLFDIGGIIMKLMVVDSDKNGWEILVCAKAWERLGITDVKYEASGEAALRHLQKEEIDIVFVEEELEDMSGTELLKRIDDSDLTCRVVLVSDCSRFEYVRDGLLYGAQGYLPKPICLEEAETVIRRIRDRMLRTGKYSMNEIKIDEYNRFQTMKYIIQKKMTDSKEIRNFLSEECGMGNIHVLLGCIIRDDNINLQLDTEDSIRAAAWVNMKRYLSDHSYFVFIMSGSEIFLLVNAVDSALYIYQLQIQLSRMLEAINRSVTEGSVSAGVSGTGFVTEIPRLYEEASCALDYRYSYGDERYLDYRICKNLEVQKQDFEEAIWHDKIQKAVKNGDQEELIEMIEACKKILHGKRKERIQEFVLKNMQMVSQERNLEEGNPVQIENSVLEIRRFDELMVAWTRFLLEKLRKYGEKHRYSYEVKEALEYIRKHYAEKITVEELAEHLEISKGHFSRIFKQQTGVPFVKYLNQYRVDRAEELIRNTNLKVYEIAEKAGIQDYTYFTQVFRSIKGISPSELRRNKKSQGDCDEKMV